MFSRTIRAIQRTPHKNVLRLYRSNWFRYFSSTTSSATETIVDEQNLYTPAKDVDVSEGWITVFNNNKNRHELYKSPYEIKETVMKNSIGMICMSTFEAMGYCMYFVPTTLFALRMMYMIHHFMSRSINKMKVLDWGQRVTVNFKMGGEATWNISDIYKNKDEKVLATTFEEPFLYPVEVKGKGTYYFYGNGHSAIKDGELFRAVVNGKSIKF